MEDSVENLICKHCKKNVLKSAVTEHLVKCLKQKREKALKKKEQKEAREREKKEAERGQESDGDGSGDDANGANKGTKKGAGKKVEGDDKKGKKRKADGEGEKGPSKKKKKEELKIKAPKAKGMSSLSTSSIIFYRKNFGADVDCSRQHPVILNPADGFPTLPWDLVSMTDALQIRILMITIHYPNLDLRKL